MAAILAAMPADGIDGARRQPAGRQAACGAADRARRPRRCLGARRGDRRADRPRRPGGAARADGAGRRGDRARQAAAASPSGRWPRPRACSCIAMGKMGARELNYSSDIDLIVLFDETRHDPDDYAELRRGFIRVTQRLVKLLSEVTGEGYVFRTDLRLRPDPSVTPVCIATEPAEHYYESVGRTWERAAYIKARVCAGAIDAGAGVPRAAAPVRLAPPPRFLGDPGRAGHAAAHPRAQGPGRAAGDPRARPEARARRHPRDRVLHPDPPADRRRPRRRPAPARHPAGARRARRPGLGRPRRRRDAGRGLRGAPRPRAPAADARRRPDPAPCRRARTALARLADFCGGRVGRDLSEPCGRGWRRSAR